MFAWYPWLRAGSRNSNLPVLGTEIESEAEAKAGTLADCKFGAGLVEHDTEEMWCLVVSVTCWSGVFGRMSGVQSRVLEVFEGPWDRVEKAIGLLLVLFCLTAY
jgi:hypothetical protein